MIRFNFRLNWMGNDEVKKKIFFFVTTIYANNRTHLKPNSTTLTRWHYIGAIEKHNNNNKRAMSADNLPPNILIDVLTIRLPEFQSTLSQIYSVTRTRSIDLSHFFFCFYLFRHNRSINSLSINSMHTYTTITHSHAHQLMYEKIKRHIDSMAMWQLLGGLYTTMPSLFMILFQLDGKMIGSNGMNERKLITITETPGKVVWLCKDGWFAKYTMT